VKYIHEKNTLSDFYSNIAKDSGMVCYGFNDTMKMLFEMNAVKHLLISEKCEGYRVTIKDALSKEEKTLYWT